MVTGTTGTENRACPNKDPTHSDGVPAQAVDHQAEGRPAAGQDIDPRV